MMELIVQPNALMAPVGKQELQPQIPGAGYVVRGGGGRVSHVYMHSWQVDQL